MYLILKIKMETFNQMKKIFKLFMQHHLFMELQYLQQHFMLQYHLHIILYLKHLILLLY